jgi:hypothetical protein
MKKTTVFFLLAAFLFAVSTPLFAQLASDPNDRMYTDLKLWEDRGLLQNLPPLKPYPIQLLKKLLTEVQERGDQQDQALAHQYYAEMYGLLNLHGVGDAEVRTDLHSGYAQFTLEGAFQGSVDPLVTYSGLVGTVVNNGSGDALLPEYGRSTVNYIFDAAVQPIGTTGFTPRVSQASSASFGTDSIYFQAGDIRGSYGPFWGDNAILSPLSPQAGQFSFVFRRDYFAVTEIVMAISATDSYGNAGPFPNKFMTFHSLEVYPSSWLTLSIFESIVWGPDFNPLFTLPFAVYYYTDGLGGFSGKSHIGVSGGFKMPSNVRADFIFYVDDMGSNDLVKLDFNTKLIFTFQAGVSWTPNLPWLTRLSFNGIMVAPYAYAHNNDNGDTPGQANYLNYTNSGQNIGPSLQPDSLRLEINALLRPGSSLDLSPFARMILHGNAGAYYGGTGTIFDYGYGVSPEPYSTFHFLDQSVIEKTFQAGFDSTAYFDTPIGKMQVSLTYTFEYVRDAGLIAGATAINNYLGMGLKYTY